MFYSFTKEHINDCVYHGNRDFDSESLEYLKNFSKAIIMQIHPNKATIIMAKARPLVAIAPLSLLVIVKPIQLVLLTLLPVAPTMDPVIKIAPTHQVKPANHVSAIDAVSPKKHAKLKGLSAK